MAMGRILTGLLVAICCQTAVTEDAHCTVPGECLASDAAHKEDEAEANTLKASLLQRTKGKGARALATEESALLARKEEILAELASIDQELAFSAESEETEDAEETEEAEKMEETDETQETEYAAEETAESSGSTGTPGTVLDISDYLDADEVKARQERLTTGLKEKFYHQTDFHACKLIFADGGQDGHNFRPGKYGLAGPGIYFAVKAFHTQWKAQKFGCMIEAVVMTGKMKEVGFDADKSLTGEKAAKAGFDSVWIPRGKRPALTPEVVIYFNDQIVKMTYYPCYKNGKRKGNYLSPKIEYNRQCAGAAAFPCVYNGGCNAPEEPDESCQCTSKCKKEGNCCSDYDAVCDKLKDAKCRDYHWWKSRYG